MAFNAGLKLATSAVPRKKRIKADAIAEIQASGQAGWKFVFCGPEDLAEIAGLQLEFELTEIWLSPAGISPAAVLEQMRLAAGPALEPARPAPAVMRARVGGRWVPGPTVSAGLC